MKIALLHTAQVHVETFESIFEKMDLDLEVAHSVAPELLDRARSEGVETVRAEVETSLMGHANADAVMCTCSTLGPLADDVGRHTPKVLRIDRPLMEAACAAGPNTLIALCLESTRQATLDLLHDCAKPLGCTMHPTVLLCSDAWALFEAGDMTGYATAIAGAIHDEVARQGSFDSIVLAQASMRVAEAELETLAIPILSSPVLAAQKCVDVARASICENQKG